MIDPYPQMSLEYALKLLQKQYGPNRVTHWSDSNIIALCIVPSGEESSITVTLAIEQAKFLAANPMTVRDLVDEKYPEAWPR